jgi:hypothetical protein
MDTLEILLALLRENPHCIDDYFHAAKARQPNGFLGILNEVSQDVAHPGNRLFGEAPDRADDFMPASMQPLQQALSDQSIGSR